MFLAYFNIRSYHRILKLLFFFVILIISDQVIGKLLRYLYFNQETGPQKTLTYVLSEVKSDILIFGNSRAQHQYDSRIFSDSLKMSCYNAGQDGGHSILLPEAQINIILKRYTPKMIILEFDPLSMEFNKQDYEKLSILLPYEKEFPELRPLLLQRSPLENLKLTSAIYPFNSNIINLIRFNTSTKAARRKDFNGYVPILNKVIDISLLDLPNNESTSSERRVYNEDPNKIKALENIINICSQKGIRLVIINSPVFYVQNEASFVPTESFTEVLNIIRENNIDFLDFTRDPFFRSRTDLFADVMHLNDKGAKIFTSELAKMLKIKFEEKMSKDLKIFEVNNLK